MIKIRIVAIATLAATALTCCPGPVEAQAAPAPGLFGPAAPDTAVLGVQRPWELRRRLAAVNLAVLRPLCAPPAGGAPGGLVVDLFDDVSVNAKAQSVAHTDRADSLRWVGAVADQPDSQVTFSIVGLCDARRAKFSLAGTVRFGGKEYSVKPRSGGRVVIAEIDTLAAGLLQKPDALPHPPSTKRLEGDSALPSGESSVIDALILYTPGAIRAAGGKDELESWITDAVSRANDEFTDSGAHVTFRVADMEPDPAYKGGETVEPAFEHLKNTADGQLDGAAALREKHGADIVTAIVAGSDPKTGVAGLASYPQNPHNPQTSTQMWSVVAADQLWTFVLAHEWGHLLGLDHDWRTSPDTDPYYPDNHGYVSPTGKFVTIMGYPTACTPACPYAPYFANPALTYQGEKLGIPLGKGARSSDNARIINLTAPQVAAYRSARGASPGSILTIGRTAGGIAAASVPGPYAKGDTVAVDAHPAAGYKLTGWTLDGVRHKADDPFSVTMDRAHTLTPLFTKGAAKAFRLVTGIAPAPGGEVTVSPKRAGYPEDAEVTAVARPHAGYAFQGWRLDGHAAGDDPHLSLRMTGDHTLTALFARAAILRLRATTGGRILATGDGTNTVVRAEPARGHRFDHWLLNGRRFGISPSPVVTLRVTGTQLLIAVFAQVKKVHVKKPQPKRH